MPLPGLGSGLAANDHAGLESPVRILDDDLPGQTRDLVEFLAQELDICRNKVCHLRRGQM